MSGRWKTRLTADQDVNDIADYIRADNIDAAIRFITTVREAYDLLAEFPRAGPLRQARSTRLAELRCWPLGGRFANYLILYMERDFGVEILRVVHGARDVTRIVDGLR